MSLDIPDSRTPIQGSAGLLSPGSVGSSWSTDGGSGAVVAHVGVEGADGEEFAGGGVDDAYVEVVDEHDDGGSVEVAAEADAADLAVDTE